MSNDPLYVCIDIIKSLLLECSTGDASTDSAALRTEGTSPLISTVM